MNPTDTLCNDITLTHNITTLINNVHVLLQAWNGTVLHAWRQSIAVTWLTDSIREYSRTWDGRS